MADQDGRHSEMITQLLRHVTSSPHDADVKVDIFRRTIYPLGLVAMAFIFSELNLVILLNLRCLFPEASQMFSSSSSISISSIAYIRARFISSFHFISFPQFIVLYPLKGALELTIDRSQHRGSSSSVGRVLH